MVMSLRVSLVAIAFTLIACGDDESTSCPDASCPADAGTAADSGPVDAGPAPDPDRDGDGLLNTEEDSNGNGAVDPGETDPDHPDTDQDGVGDFDESGSDADSDGLSDAVESATFDEDGDGVPDDSDADPTDGPCAGERRLGGTHTGDVSLGAACSPYLVEGTFVVSGGTLTFEAGVTVRFGYDAVLRLGDSQGASSWTSAGTLADPVVLRSHDATPAAGDWGGVEVRRGDTVALDYTTVEHGGGLAVHDAVSLSVENSTFAEHRGHALYVNIPEHGGAPATLVAAFANNTFQSNQFSLGISLARLPEFDLLSSSFTDGPIELLGERLERSVTLSDRGVPYFAEGSVLAPSVAAPAPPTALRLDAGVQLRFPAGASLTMGSADPGSTQLTVAGAAGNPVVLGVRPDSDGRWAGIRLVSSAATLNEVVMLGVGASDAESAPSPAISVAAPAVVSVNGPVTVDGAGVVMHHHVEDCTIVTPLSGFVTVLGYQDCQVRCTDTDTDVAICVQL